MLANRRISAWDPRAASGTAPYSFRGPRVLQQRLRRRLPPGGWAPLPGGSYPGLLAAGFLSERIAEMKTVALQDLPRWRIYKKVRKAIRLELLEAGMSTDEDSIDDYLRVQLRDVIGDLRRAFRADLAEKETRRREQLRDSLGGAQ